MWVLQHHSVHAFDMSTIIVFVYLGLQVKWNQLSSNNSHHTSCVHKGSHAGKWPDLTTSQPDSVTTLGYHWTDHTGRPLEPQVHWDATGTTLAYASTQWCSSGDPVLICIIGTHWKTTGRPLEVHWLPKFFLQWHSSVHWGLSSRHTGLPLDCHWKTTGSGTSTCNISSLHMMPTSDIPTRTTRPDSYNTPLAGTAVSPAQLLTSQSLNDTLLTTSSLLGIKAVMRS